jgi:hypothetical protein
MRREIVVAERRIHRIAMGGILQGFRFDFLAFGTLAHGYPFVQ